MEEISFMTQTLSVISLLIICSFTYILSKKINFPYTVLLVVVGLLLVPISNIEFFSFIDDFKLTPELLFFVFLPVLLFESAYNIKYKNLLKNIKAISLLAIFWLMISWLLLAISLYFIFPFIWIQVPFLVCLMFWVLISATDPVAVLSIFKRLWAPRWLTILFEWESLFNDGTAVALFLVILWVILEWWIVTQATYLEWSLKFLSMLFGWLLFWGLTWVFFSKIIASIKNNEEVEIVLTMLLAHVTFILAELISHHYDFLPISWVIATVVASIVIWNYWRYKITPRVEIHMQKFWEFFAFVSNSLVFILMWLILSNIDINFSDFILPIIIVILSLVIIRWISVYLSISFVNIFKLEEKIPKNWIILLSWWSLWWALAIMMVLMIPWVWDVWYDKILAFQSSVWWFYSFSIKEFLLVLTIWSIMFTLLVKAPITTYIMKELKVDKLHKLEKFEYEESKMLTNIKILEKLDNLHKKFYLTKIEFDNLTNIYSNNLKQAKVRMKSLLWNNSKNLVKKAISLHALWMEKWYLKDLFYYNEISEANFKYILRKIEFQVDRVEYNHSLLEKITSRKNKYDMFSRFTTWFNLRKFTEIDSYIRNRTRVVITRKVIADLRKLQEIDFPFDKKVFEEVIDIYADLSKKSDIKRMTLFVKHKEKINDIESSLINKSLLKLEEKTIKDLYKKEVITPKLYIKFMENIEKNIYSDLL